MLFNTWTFLIFLAVTFAAYHLLPWPDRHRVWWQIGLLTVASYVFYAWHTPWLVIILAFSTWINAYVTIRLVRPGASDSERGRWVTLAVVMNLLVLIFFKYASLVVGTFLPQSWWSHWGFDLTQIPLPVGISFFTFQGISLVVDVYRKPEVVLGQPGDGSWVPAVGQKDGIGKQPATDVCDKYTPIASKPSTLFFKVAFFKAFFPQLIAGPIVKAREFIHQIGPKSLASVDWDDAVRKLILGFFLKMVVADNLREATAWLHYPEFLGKPASVLILMLYGFSLQIFADFAGYSLIAMGLARLFGYQLPINFNSPYISGSITEFWRRWHISLSTWLREYLYIPLGGNRKGSIRTYVNLIVVMLLGGLWHGASWSFMVWGGVHGICLALERLFGVKGEPIRQYPHGLLGMVISGVRIFLIFNIISFLWLLFQLTEIRHVGAYLQELLKCRSGSSPQITFIVLFFGFPIVLYHFWGVISERFSIVLAEEKKIKFSIIKNFVYGVLLFLIVVNSGSSGSFIYFQF
jgi:alginate O-acetyltransferase complex protein AlgI